MIVIDSKATEAYLPSPARAVELMTDTLIALGRGEANTIPKVETRAEAHPGEKRSYANAMPAAWPARDLFGIKWVTLSPRNADRGKPFVQGNVILSDPDEGDTLAIIDAAPLTALRTAAVTGASLAIDAERRDVTFLGTGVQARSHLQVLEGLEYPRMTVWGRSEDSLAQLREWAQHHTPNIELHTTTEWEKAVHEAGVIISGLAMRVPGRTLYPTDVVPDVTLLPLDYGTVMGVELAQQATVVADDPTQFEALRPKKICPEYPQASGATGALIEGERPAGIVLAQNLGSGLGDIVLAHEVYTSYLDDNAG